ncbi:MAG: DUF2834 domain-containing protein [Nocardia sp.]|nr:DUF2834 domain-containing protein [Nocardia sp.]
MPRSRKLLCAAYMAISIAALILTWSQNVAYRNDIAGFLGHFVHDTKSTPAARSIMVDLMLLTLAAMIFMVVEGRKRAIRFVWAYVAGGAIIGISVAFPLFLLARELRGTSADPVRLETVDGIALSVLWVLMGIAAIYVGTA